MPVGRRQVEPSVVVRVDQRRAEAQQVPSRLAQPDHRGAVGEQAVAEVPEEGRRLAVEVGHDQVEPAVAVEVAAGHPHPRLVAAFGVGRHARDQPDLLEPEAAEVAEQEVRRAVVGHEEVDPAVVVEVGGEHPEPPAIGDR